MPGSRDASPAAATPAPDPPPPAAATAARCYRRCSSRSTRGRSGRTRTLTSLYGQFHELRDAPAEAFAEEFRAAAGVPMTMPTAGASSVPQGQQAGAPASWEPNGVQVDVVTAEPPSAPAPGRGDAVMLTSNSRASLRLLGSKENSSTTGPDTMCGVEGAAAAAEQIKDRAGGDHVMHDVEVGVMETKYQPDSDLKHVKGLLSTGLLEGFRVTYRKDEVENVGRINGQGYSCGCSNCNYSKIMNARYFEKHSGQSSYNQNDHIFLDNGISLFSVVKALKPCKLNMLGDFFEEKIGFPPNLNEYNKWKASFQKRKDHLDAVASDGCPTQSNTISNRNWTASKRRSGGQFRQGGTETSTATFSESPGKGVSDLSTGFSEKKGTEETCSENIGGPQSIDVVKSDSPVPTAVSPRYCKHDSTNLGLSLSSPVTIAQDPVPNCTIDSKSKESKTSQLHLSHHNASHANFTLKESACNIISQFIQGGTKTSTPSFSASPGNGVFGLSTGTSEKKGIEETSSENAGDPFSIDDVKSDSPVPTAVIPNYPKHDSTNLGLSLSSPVKITQGPLPNCSIDSKSKESKKRDTTTHQLIFKEGGLADNTLLTYNKSKNGEVLKQGYKRGMGIVCNCCSKEFTPTHFEEHAGMGSRRHPYHNIYTSEGLSLHKLALQLQDHLNSYGSDNASVSSFSEYPNLTSSGCIREPSTTRGPIVPLKRTLQQRVIETEFCYFCGYGHTTIGNIDPDTIIFCNQCERPCHVKCYNNRVLKKKLPVEILKEYMCFRFLCCQECQSLRGRLEEGMEKCEEIAFLRRIRSDICWQLLRGMDASRDVKLYIPQVIDIFKDAFMESTDENSDIFSDMVNGKNGHQEKDFRGMYCALLTASTHVVSAAILKVHMEQIAELVLIATRRECRKKGYFILLLKSIEAKLRAWNVSLLAAPVDPEMAHIWSGKLGFTILSAKEKESVLESQPLVMFKNLVLVQKSLA